MASYFQKPLGISHIPDFVRASTPAGLRKAILRNNTKHQGFVVYQDIQWVQSESRWYAWYYVTEDLEGLDGVMKDGGGK